MLMEKKTRFGIAISCVLMVLVLGIMPGAISYVQASLSDITSDSIKDKEEQIQASEAEKNKLESSVTDLQEVLAGLESSKNNLNDYIVELDASLSDIHTKLTELATLISEKEKEIAETKAELEIAIEIEELQYAQMQKRIQFIYEDGGYALADMLLSSSSFADILNKADYVEMLSAYDRKMLNSYIETREIIEDIKSALEAEEDVLKTAQEATVEEENAMEGLISAKEEEIQRYEADIDNKEALRQQLEAEIEQENEIIKALELAVAEERRKIAEENGILPSYDGGTFAWPAPSYTYISSDYGNRTDPFTGLTAFHNGVDMAAPYQSPILAAYDGKVVQAGYSSSMGNYILIDHGDDLYTIYMHASELYVSTDQIVVRGEKIAGVGSTGRSTGNHLHFGVRLNGSYVSPWTYLQ